MSETDSDNRSRALAMSRYLSAILSSVLGRDVKTQVVVQMCPATSGSRQLVLTLSLEDAKTMTDALNREPEKP